MGRFIRAVNLCFAALVSACASQTWPEANEAALPDRFWDDTLILPAKADLALRRLNGAREYDVERSAVYEDRLDRAVARAFGLDDQAPVFPSWSYDWRDKLAAQAFDIVEGARPDWGRVEVDLSHSGAAFVLSLSMTADRHDTGHRVSELLVGAFFADVGPPSAGDGAACLMVAQVKTGEIVRARCTPNWRVKDDAGADRLVSELLDGWSRVGS